MNCEICIEGTKAAGKTTTISLLEEHLSTLGFQVKVSGVFFEAKQFAFSQGFDGSFAMAQTQTGALEMFDFIKNYLLESQSYFIKKGISENGIIIHDRGWMTVYCHIYDSCLDDDIKKTQWNICESFFMPTYFIHTKPENSIVRKPDKVVASEGFPSISALKDDYLRRQELCKKYLSSIKRKFETPDCSSEFIVGEIMNDILISRWR